MYQKNTFDTNHVPCPTNMPRRSSFTALQSTQFTHAVDTLQATGRLLVDLLAIDASGPAHEPRGIVHCAESTDGGADALVHEIAWDDDPEGVHEDKVAPVVCGLGARVRYVEDVVVEHGGCIVEHIAVELAERDDELEGVAQGMIVGDQAGGDEGAGPPESLQTAVSVMAGSDEGRRLTAVTVSMQSTKASCVRYRESLRLYSFHSCPNRSCMLPMRL